MTTHSEADALATKTLNMQRFSGDIDISNEFEFQYSLATVCRQPPGYLILDMLAVDFISASALAIFADFLAEATTLRAMAVAVTCNRPIARSLEVCGLDRTVEIYPSLDDARAAVYAKAS